MKPITLMTTQPNLPEQLKAIEMRCPATASFETGDLWSVWEAARRLLPADTPPERLHGLTGGAIRRHDDGLVYNDLAAWVVPGLAALDVRAIPTLVPEDHDSCVALLRANLRGGRTLPLLIYGEEAAPAAEIETEPGAEREAAPPEQPVTETVGIGPAAPLLRQRLIVAASQGLDEIFVEDETGQQLLVGVSWLRTGRAMVLHLGRQLHQGTRRAGLREALRRWVVFAAAHPERIITPYEEDAPRRALAAAFLGEMVGTRQDRQSGMLRRASRGLATAAWEEDIQDALDYLRAAVALEFQLSSREMEALTSPPIYGLSEIERRELIYLARAGVRDLRILAARRLVSEQTHDDARRTLEQLRYDEDAWVRAVSAAL